MMVRKAALQPCSHEADLNTEWQVMNEIALHRGSSPHLNTIDIYVDGQHLTEAVVRSTLFQAPRFTNYRSLMV
jgi:NADH kinase